MGKLKILDCTLRDGGYINNWHFGNKTITKIIQDLTEANIDIIECGFLSDIEYDCDYSLYDGVERFNELFKSKNPNIMYVAMIALGEKDISSDKIKPYDGTNFDGIRITFHEHEINQAKILAEQLMDKGYKVFMQPIGTTSYSDENLIKLINIINQLNPYAFYLVDTLGIMYKNDLLRLFYLVDHNLNPDIVIGFHSHNNLQLSFSNAQELLMLHTKREIIVDSSVFGMGRGAGNLCTELLACYINENIEIKYNIIPLLEIVDNYLSKIYAQYTWGYSMPYFLAAANNCHPNYASHLLNKQTISVKTINTLLKRLPDHKRTLFDKNYIEEAYISYLQHYIDDSKSFENIKREINGHSVLVLAPGKSIENYDYLIREYIQKEKPIVISVNFIPYQFNYDMVFVSNLKRFSGIEECIDTVKDKHLIVTSNIKTNGSENVFSVNYADLLNKDTNIVDDAGTMLLNLLHSIGVKKVTLAGFDGFSSRPLENYFTEKMVYNVDAETLQSKSEAITSYLRELSAHIEIKFLTPSLYKQILETT
ncbi:MAG TPA: 4-hydroxy-2-ketovalerate aldolase [Ruminococcaceae bacterium]|nr:4-hydroxy-2-ketovalerate aldolase [Oscillospiraceae bacterium]